jgi:tripartite-type tricarboxylate transporter receptor subunit TctC
MKKPSKEDANMKRLVSTIFTAGLGLALSLAATARPAVAQDYPARPIQLMVAFPPGGSTDIGARVVAAIAERAIGQPIVIVNKGGAGGQIGWTDLARQKPDGYNIGFINLPATNTVILDPDRKAIFTEKDFTPIINQVLDPGLIWVRADSPYKTVHDLIAAARKAPSTIRAATTGILSDDHLAILMTEEAAPGATFRIVHLDGSASQFKEIMAGNIDVAYDNVGGIVPRVRSGEVRALAVLDDARSKFLPDVPTTKELGYPTVISSSTRGIAGPKGMPAPIVNRLREVLERAMADPEHVKKLEDQGLAIKIMVGDEYARYFADTHAKAKKYTEWAKNRPQK